jgi:hypothetical protein
MKMMITAARLVRTPNGGEDCDHLLILINFSGSITISSLGRQLTLSEGEAVLLDGAEPFIIQRGLGSCYVVRIPRARISGLVFKAGSTVMKKLLNTSGVLNFFTTYVDTVLHHADRTSPLVHRLTYKHVTDLMAILLERKSVAASGGSRPLSPRGMRDPHPE